MRATRNKDRKIWRWSGKFVVSRSYTNLADSAEIVIMARTTLTEDAWRGISKFETVDKCGMDVGFQGRRGLHYPPLFIGNTGLSSNDGAKTVNIFTQLLYGELTNMGSGLGNIVNEDRAHACDIFRPEVEPTRQAFYKIENFGMIADGRLEKLEVPRR